LLRQSGALCIAGNHDRAVCGQITTESFSTTAARAVAWTRAHLTSEEIAFLCELPLRANVRNELLAVHGAFHPLCGCEIVRLDDDERRLLSFKALMADPSAARIGAFGHTHAVAIYELRGGHARLRPEQDVTLRDDAHYLINPGALGQSWSSDRRGSYMILDLARRAVAVRRVCYDAAAALAKTRKAGLASRASVLPVPLRSALKIGWRALGLDTMARLSNR
jgi:predicted phosphodiesterase